jgi:hypothetical protein
MVFFLLQKAIEFGGMGTFKYQKYKLGHFAAIPILTAVLRGRYMLPLALPKRLPFADWLYVNYRRI